jgi:hypothetical protein
MKIKFSIKKKYIIWNKIKFFKSKKVTNKIKSHIDKNAKKSS